MTSWTRADKLSATQTVLGTFIGILGIIVGAWYTIDTLGFKRAIGIKDSSPPPSSTIPPAPTTTATAFTIPDTRIPENKKNTQVAPNKAEGFAVPSNTNAVVPSPLTQKLPTNDSPVKPTPDFTENRRSEESRSSTNKSPVDQDNPGVTHQNKNFSVTLKDWKFRNSSLYCNFEFNNLLDKEKRITILKFSKLFCGDNESVSIAEGNIPVRLNPSGKLVVPVTFQNIQTTKSKATITLEIGGVGHEIWKWNISF